MLPDFGEGPGAIAGVVTVPDKNSALAESNRFGLPKDAKDPGKPPPAKTTGGGGQDPNDIPKSQLDAGTVTPGFETPKPPPPPPSSFLPVPPTPLPPPPSPPPAMPFPPMSPPPEQMRATVNETLWRDLGIIALGAAAGVVVGVAASAISVPWAIGTLAGSAIFGGGVLANNPHIVSGVVQGLGDLIGSAPQLGQGIGQAVGQIGSGIGQMAATIPPFDPSGSTVVDSARSLAQEVPDALKQRYACDKFADALQEKLKEAGVQGQRLQISLDRSGPGIRIWSDSLGELAQPGQPHVAIRVGGTVFDNMRPGGIPFEQWVNDLGGVQLFGHPAVTFSENPF